MLASTIDEMITLLRVDLGDEMPEGDTEDDDRLWKTAEIERYFTRAIDRWAKDTDGLQKVLTLPVVAGEDTIRLPRHVLDIRAAKLVDLNTLVEVANYNDSTPSEFYREDYGRVGGGYRLVRDYHRASIILYPEPTRDDTLELQCTVTLAVPAATGMMMPTHDVEDQELILHYAKYCAYSKQDAETRDTRKAAEYKALYEAGARQRKSSLARYRRAPGAVRMSNW